MSADTASPVSPGGNPMQEEEVHKAQQSTLSAPSPRGAALPYRLSSYEKPPSRTTSTVFPLFHSSLYYALVRDFAYPPFNPLHYGPIEGVGSADSTPTQDYDPSRRVSDPPPWDSSAGPWRDSSDAHGSGSGGGTQQLPSTSFDDQDDGSGSHRTSRRISKHRKSRSYADMNDYSRSRRDRKPGKPSYFSGAGGAGGSGAGHSPRTPRPGGPDDDLDTPTTMTTLTGRGPTSEDDDPTQPPFREDSDSVPYSPSTLEEHRPESASLDESFAGPSLALYDFAPENDNELELREGQIIQVGYRHGQGWLVAMNLETGEQGLVPEEYVRLLRDIEGWEGKVHGQGHGLGGGDADRSPSEARTP